MCCRKGVESFLNALFLCEGRNSIYLVHYLESIDSTSRIARVLTEKQSQEAAGYQIEREDS